MSIKLYKGDCLEIMKQLHNENIVVDLIITDPPYGTTACKWDSIIPFDKMWSAINNLIKPNAAVLLFGQTPFDKVLGVSNISRLKYEWIWLKSQGTGFLNAKKAPLKVTENILVFYESLPTYNPIMRFGFKPYIVKSGNASKNYKEQKQVITKSNGERYPLNLLEFAKDKRKYHPTQKPVALLEYLIKTYTNEGETVLDFTMGSGTTGVACQNINRSFIGIEF